MGCSHPLKIRRAEIPQPFQALLIMFVRQSETMKHDTPFGPLCTRLSRMGHLASELGTRQVEIVVAQR